MAEAAPEGFEALFWAFRRIQGREAWESHGAMIERLRPPLGPGVGDRFAFGREIGEREIAEARALRAGMRERLLGLLGADRVMLLPTMPDVAPRLSEPEEALNDYRNRALNLLCLSGLSGFPQATLPLARRDGAPLGLSLIGPPGSDASLVRLAARIAGAAGS
jgi:amidase